jgi:hypothetical protein
MQALQRAKSAMRTNTVDALIVSRLAAESRFDEARDYIDEADDALPLHPLRRLSTTIALKQLRREVEMLEMQAINGAKAGHVSASG